MGRHEEAFLRASNLAMALFIAEAVFGGSGRWVSFGPVSIRMLLFTGAFILSFPLVVIHRKELLRNPYLIAVGSFGAALIVSAAVGVLNGNPRSFLWADITSFLTLALFPGFLVTMGKEPQRSWAVDILFYSAAFTGAVAFILHILTIFLPAPSINALNIWINGRSLGGFATLETGLQRVYLKSEMFLHAGIIVGVCKIREASGWKKRLLYFLIGLMGTALLLSFTRGLWMALAVGAVVFLILEPGFRKSFLLASLLSCAVMCLLLLGSSLLLQSNAIAAETLNRFDISLPAAASDKEAPVEEAPVEEAKQTQETSGALLEDRQPAAGFDMKFDPDRQMSAEDANRDALEIRRLSLQGLNALIARRPFLGSGLGKNLDEIRNDGKCEYMYQDILMKMGIFGFAAFLAAFFLPPADYLFRVYPAGRRAPSETAACKRWRASALTAGYLGLAAASYTNPYLSNPAGITMLMLTAIYTGRPVSSGSRQVPGNR